MTGYPPQYVYYLLCCFRPGCIHPLCQKHVGMSQSNFMWFPQGPPLTYLPLPVPDPERPWGNNSCQQCSGFCNGHFLVPQDALSSNAVQMAMAMPPSSMIQQAMKQSEVSELSKKVLLPEEEVQFWISHLKTVATKRKRGAQKAAVTRRAKRAHSRRNVSTYFCSKCGEAYEDETDEVQKWIACDLCDLWYHWDCVGVTTEPDTYICDACVSSHPPVCLPV